MAGSIQFGGVVSGLNTSSIIDALMTEYKKPLQDLQTREDDLTAQKNAYADIGTSLSDLLTKIRAFTTANAGSGRSATVGDTSLFTASAAATALTGQYRISVDRLATATVARSTGSLGSPVTDPSQTLSNLNLPGLVTSGQITAIVDGTLVHYTVGNPDTTSLTDVLNGLASGIQTQLQTGGNGVAADPTATVTASVVDNRIQLSVTGAAGTHSLRFGAASDTSNALGVLGMSTLTATNATNPTLTGTVALGVVRTSTALDSAGLSGLTSTTSGVLTINGTAVNYNTATDSLATIISRINASNAGVIASLDRTNDQLVLTRKDQGATAIDIEDTSGTLGAALKLAPGTITAQTIGQTAQVTVNGQTVVSDSNHVTGAIDGVTLDLLDLSQTGTTTTLTVGVDNAKIKSALNDFITSFNALADKLDKYTVNTPGKDGQAGTTGPLATDWNAQKLYIDLRTLVSQGVAGLAGTYTSLASIGVTTGAVGSALSSTKRLSLDEDKLDAALAADPQRVASLLDDATGAMKPMLDKVTQLTSSTGFVQSSQDNIDDQIRLIEQQKVDEQERIDAKQADLERKYAAMEALLSTLQSQASALTAYSSAGTSSSSGSSSSSS